jgi:hypothetical protein
MGIPLKKWWTEGEDSAVAVYRAHLMIPLIILTAIVLTEYTMFSGSGARKHLSFFFGCWTVCAAGLTIRRRRAAIFTKDTFIFRPVFGQLLRVPLAGIKRAYWIDWRPDKRHRILLCVEFLVGGQVEIQMKVRKSGEVLSRLQAAASP